MLSHINVGAGNDLTIASLAKLIGKVVGYTGQVEFDHEKPDGAHRKLMDGSRLNNLGWQPTVKLEDGLKFTYKNFLRINDL